VKSIYGAVTRFTMVSSIALLAGCATKMSNTLTNFPTNAIPQQEVGYLFGLVRQTPFSNRSGLTSVDAFPGLLTRLRILDLTNSSPTDFRTVWPLDNHVGLTETTTRQESHIKGNNRGELIVVPISPGNYRISHIVTRSTTNLKAMSLIPRKNTELTKREIDALFGTLPPKWADFVAKYLFITELTPAVPEMPEPFQVRPGNCYYLGDIELIRLRYLYSRGLPAGVLMISRELNHKGSLVAADESEYALPPLLTKWDNNYNSAVSMLKSKYPNLRNLPTQCIWQSPADR